MTPKEIQQCLEDAFGSIQPPDFEQLTRSFGMDSSFEEAVRTETASARRWQELRPLRRYLGGALDIILLTPKATQYYLPAYLYAAMDEHANEVNDELWLGPILTTLFYEDEYGDPLFNNPGLRDTWEELIGLLTDQQKRCVAHWLVEIVRRLDDPSVSVYLEVDRIEHMLEGYWKAWL